MITSYMRLKIMGMHSHAAALPIRMLILSRPVMVLMTPGGTWAIAFSYADCIRAPVWPEGKAALSLSFPAGKNVGGALRLPKRMPYL